MYIRLGFVGTPLTLPNSTYSSTVTYTYYTKLGPTEGRKKIDQVIRSNFQKLKEVLTYNLQNDITFYRISQNLIPLATKKEVPFERLPKKYTKRWIYNLLLKFTKILKMKKIVKLK